VTQFRMISELEKSHASKRIRDLHLSAKIRDRNKTAISKFYVNRGFSLLLTAYSWCTQAYSGAYMAAHQ